MNNFETRSYYIDYQNQTLKWLPSDTKKLFEYNLKHHHSLLEKYNWIDREITYKFNSHGFRCEEFTDNPSVMFLGCSYTVGIGLPLESTWAHIVSKNLNLQNVNLGLGSGSADSSFRMCLSYIDKIKPKVICYLRPPKDRYELIRPYDTELSVPGCMWAAGSWDLDSGDRLQKTLFKYWSLDESNSILNEAKNELAIKQLCHERKIKLCSLTRNEFKDVNFFDISSARDLMHTGEEFNRGFADEVIKIINSVY